MAQIDEKKDLYICAAECIIEKDGKFLVITRPQGVHAGGLMAFPGGKVEQYDGADGQHIFEQAAKREVLEEVGMKLLDPLKLVTSSFFFDEHTRRPVIDCVFHCRAVKTNCTVIAHEREVPHYQWLTKAEIKEHPNAPIWVKRYIGLL
jgi:8-oxo-dGTP diphosphatase